MGSRAWLLRCGFTATVASATLLLGACTRPGAGENVTPSAPVSTARPSATITRVATRTAAAPPPSVAPSTAPNTAPSTAPSSAPSTAPSAAPSTAPAGGTGQKYVVQAGDTLSGIADQFGVTIQQLIDANSLQNPDLLLPGQELIIPAR